MKNIKMLLTISLMMMSFGILGEVQISDNFRSYVEKNSKSIAGTIAESQEDNFANWSTKYPVATLKKITQSLSRNSSNIYLDFDFNSEEQQFLVGAVQAQLDKFVGMSDAAGKIQNAFREHKKIKNAQEQNKANDLAGIIYLDFASYVVTHNLKITKNNFRSHLIDLIRSKKLKKKDESFMIDIINDEKEKNGLFDFVSELFKQQDSLAKIVEVVKQLKSMNNEPVEAQFKQYLKNNNIVFGKDIRQLHTVLNEFITQNKSNINAAALEEFRDKAHADKDAWMVKFFNRMENQG
jgi:formate dehydrogenase maturation protein FdhE